MDKFCAAARCSAGKVPLLQKEGAIAAADSVYSCSEAGGAAADYNDIPWFGMIVEPLQKFRS